MAIFYDELHEYNIQQSFSMLSEKEKEKLLSNLWKQANDLGVYSVDQLNDALDKLPKHPLWQLLIPSENTCEEERQKLSVIAKNYGISIEPINKPQRKIKNS